MTAPRRIVIVGSDLFFSTRIRTAADAAGVEVREAAAKALMETCRGEAPDLVIVDLHADGALAGVRELRSDPNLRTVRVIGFYSHVQETRRRAALEAGVDEAMPRSTFTAKLGRMLEGIAGRRMPDES